MGPPIAPRRLFSAAAVNHPSLSCPAEPPRDTLTLMTVSTVTRAAGRTAPPARPAIRIQYASFESRFAAATLDFFVLCILGALLVTAGSLIVLISSDFERRDASTMSLNLFWGCVGSILPAVLLYFFIAFAWKGQTIGSAIMQLMVVRSDGRPLGVLGAVARILGILLYVVFIAAGGVVAFFFRRSTPIAAGAIGAGLALCVLGLLIAVFDSKRRTLQDRLAGTIVVRLL